MTKFILKTSLFITVLTLIYCTITNVPLTESLLRSLVVFVGTYTIIIVCLVGLRIILNPGAPKGVEGEQ